MRVMWVLLVLVVAGCSEAPAPAEAQQDLGDVDEQLRATATTGVIRGVVVDAAVVPVADATIDIMAKGLSTTSNADGAFGFSGIEPGTYFLQVSKEAYNATQVAVTVVAGVDRPAIVRVLIEREPGSEPFVDPISFNGFLACGAAIFYTSVGCTTNGFLASNTQSTSIWSLDFERLPRWMQGELVWESNQPAAGNFIWQIVQSEYPGTPQPHIGFMETTHSPALTYLNTTVIDEYEEWILDKGVDYRFFGGPHDLCPQHVGDPAYNRFGCGVTVDQAAQVFIHHFYNFVPRDGWRFTSDGPPEMPS